MLTLVYLSDSGTAMSSTVPRANIREIVCESPRVWVAYIQLASLGGVAGFQLRFEDVCMGCKVERAARETVVSHEQMDGVPIESGADVWSWLETAKIVRCRLRSGRAGSLPENQRKLTKPSISIC